MFDLPFPQQSIIHLIGISGAETSTVAAFLAKEGFTNLIGHDAGEEHDFRANFWRLHDWMDEEEKRRSFDILKKSISQWRFGKEYLQGIEIPPTPLIAYPSEALFLSERRDSDSAHSLNEGEGGRSEVRKEGRSEKNPMISIAGNESAQAESLNTKYQIPNIIIFVPQSWFRYETNEPLRKYFEKDLRVKAEYRDRIWSMTKLYLELFPGKIIGVTGSNGKSTTTAMIAAMIRQAAISRQSSAGSHQHSAENKKQKHKDPNPIYHIPYTKYRLFWGGNDRKNPQPLEEISNATKNDILLLEMSDRQLSLGLSRSPNVAVLTNVTPNHHLDDHGTFEAYVKVKEEIVRHQTEGDVAILNWNNEASRSAKNVTMADVVFFDVNPEDKPVPQAFVGSRREGGELVFYDVDGKRSLVAHVEDVAVPGEHNVENALAAIAAVSSFGVRSEDIREVLQNFKGLDHRLELVAEKNGVRYINDSSSTDAANIVTTVGTLFSAQHKILGAATVGTKGKVSLRLSSPLAGEEKEMRGSKATVLLQRAKDMRHAPTESEARLWSLLRNRRLEGYKFRRQQAIGPYIVDFVCLEKKVIAEADGSQHAEGKAEQYDRERTRFLEGQGFRVLRFWNNEILENPEGVWDIIARTLETPHSQPLSHRGRGEKLHPSPPTPLPQGERVNTLMLIAGGYRKNPVPGEFLPVAEVVRDKRVKHVFLIGSVQEMFEKELLQGGAGPEKITRCANLEEAFAQAKEKAVPGDTVALTPGCESFGEFRDYRERGERFRRLVDLAQ